MRAFIYIAVFLATFTGRSLALPTSSASKSISTNVVNEGQNLYGDGVNGGDISMPVGMRAKELPGISNDIFFRREEVTAAEATSQDAKPKGSSASAKAAKKLASQKKFSAAAAAHKATTNLPGRKQEFQVPGGGPKFSGKDVRKAVFDSHVEEQANQGKSKTQLKKSPLKDFKNSNHHLPHPHKPNDTKSINHMKETGKEFPLGDPVNKGPARVITQQTNDGHTKFKGVVAHDISRVPGSVGYNDHFQVKPTGSKHK